MYYIPWKFTVVPLASPGIRSCNTSHSSCIVSPFNTVACYSPVPLSSTYRQQSFVRTLAFVSMYASVCYSKKLAPAEPKHCHHSANSGCGSSPPLSSEHQQQPLDRTTAFPRLSITGPHNIIDQNVSASVRGPSVLQS